MLSTRAIRRALIVAPKTLLHHWEMELRKVGLGSKTVEYDGTKNQRREALARVHARPSVMLATYGMVLHNEEDLTRCRDA